MFMYYNHIVIEIFSYLVEKQQIEYVEKKQSQDTLLILYLFLDEYLISFKYKHIKMLLII